MVFTVSSKRTLLSISLASILSSLCSIGFTLPVNAYYGHYNAAEKVYDKPPSSLVGPVEENWSAPSNTVPYSIAALVPHLKDPYWLGINYALIEQARKLGISIKIFDAGGYGKGGVQSRQLSRDVVVEKIQGVIIAPIHYDKLDRFVAGITKIKIPVISLINDTLAPHISGKVLVSRFNMGYQLGQYVIQDAAGEDIRIAFFPGPKLSGWAPELFKGFIQAIEDNPGAHPLGKVTIVAEQYGPLQTGAQAKIIDFVLANKEGINYLITNHVGAMEAPKLLANHKSKHPNAKVIATFMTRDVFIQLREQKIYAAIYDQMMAQARLSLELLVKHLQRNPNQPGDSSLPFRLEPRPMIVDLNTLGEVNEMQWFGPEKYQPTLQYLAGS